jgi:glycosyltransferase involved in cell wall biosynthesis
VSSAGRSILYIAAEYRSAEVRAKKHEHNFEARHASGYFERVYSVHPVADLVGAERYRIQLIRFTPRQLVIEGVAELFRLPRFLLPLNFLLSQARLLFLLRRIVLKNDVSVIAATDPFLSGVLALALSKMTGKPLVIRNGGNYEELYREAGALAMPRLIPTYGLQSLIARFVLRRADMVAGNNRNNLGWAIANGARRHTAIIPISGNIARIHMRPPEERTRGREVFARLGLPFGVPAMLYVGRLLKLKQPDEALRAMAMVMEKEPSAIGILAGDGPMLTELDALATELGMHERIFFLGQTTQEDLSEIIPHCITASPLTGLSLIECGLGGSPPVGFDRDWQPDPPKRRTRRDTRPRHRIDFDKRWPSHVRMVRTKTFAPAAKGRVRERRSRPPRLRRRHRRQVRRPGAAEAAAFAFPAGWGAKCRLRPSWRSVGTRPSRRRSGNFPPARD